jgi:hypothetical protein
MSISSQPVGFASLARSLYIPIKADSSNWKGIFFINSSYNSREVGYALAKAFLQTVDFQLSMEMTAQDNDKLPNFYLPLPFACYIPNDLFFVRIKAIKETIKKVNVTVY